MFTLMGILFAVFLFFGLQVKYEEDISKLLPNSDVESQLAFSSIGLKDKVFIQVTSSGEPLSVEELTERTDEFIDLLIKNGKQFLVIGPQTAPTEKSIIRIR